MFFGLKEVKWCREEYFQTVMNNGTDGSEDPGDVIGGPTKQDSEAEIQQTLKPM